MSDQTQTGPQGTPAPAAQPEPVAAPAATPAPEPSAEPRAPQTPPAWLGPRLEQAREAERKRLLNDFGFPDSEALKARLAEAKRLEEATLSEQEKAKLRIQELEPIAQQAKALEEWRDRVVQSQFDALPDHQKEAVDRVAQGDQSKRWEIMSVLSAVGSAPASPAAEPPPAAPLPVPASPATTVPGKAPPSPAPVRTKWEEWNAITNPVQKAIFWRSNRKEIELTAPGN